MQDHISAPLDWGQSQPSEIALRRLMAKHPKLTRWGLMNLSDRDYGRARAELPAYPEEYRIACEFILAGMPGVPAGEALPFLLAQTPRRGMGRGHLSRMVLRLKRRDNRRSARVRLGGPTGAAECLAQAAERFSMNALGSRPSMVSVEQARGFLAALAAGETAFTFQTFDDSGAKRRELARVIHGTLEERLDKLTRLSALGAGVFMTANRTDLRGRREANIVAVRALFVDLDGAPIPDLNRLGLLAHILVETSPGRFHLYWLVKGVARTEFTALQKRLAALLGGDPSVIDLPRVMRLPGFPHQKNHAGPHMVRFWENESLAPYEANAFRAKLSVAEKNCAPQPNPNYSQPSRAD